MASENLNLNNQNIEDLLETFKSASLRKRKGLIPLIEQRSNEMAQIASSVISSFDQEGDDWAPGFLLQVLNRHEKGLLVKFLQSFEKTLQKINLEQ